VLCDPAAAEAPAGQVNRLPAQPGLQQQQQQPSSEGSSSWQQAASPAAAGLARAGACVAVVQGLSHPIFQHLLPVDPAAPEAVTGSSRAWWDVVHGGPW